MSAPRRSYARMNSKRTIATRTIAVRSSTTRRSARRNASLSQSLPEFLTDHRALGPNALKVDGRGIGLSNGGVRRNVLAPIV